MTGTHSWSLLPIRKKSITQKCNSCTDGSKQQSTCRFTTQKTETTWSLLIKLFTRHLDHPDHLQLLKQDYWITVPDTLFTPSLSCTPSCFLLLCFHCSKAREVAALEASEHRKELPEDPAWMDSAANPFHKAAIPSLTILISQQLKPGAEESVREPQGKEFLCIYPRSEHPSAKYLMKSKTYWSHQSPEPSSLWS